MKSPDWQGVRVVEGIPCGDRRLVPDDVDLGEVRATATVGPSGDPQAQWERLRPLLPSWQWALAVDPDGIVSRFITPPGRWVQHLEGDVILEVPSVDQPGKMRLVAQRP